MAPTEALRCTHPPLVLLSPNLLVPAPFGITQLVTYTLEVRKVTDSYAPSDIADYLKDAVFFMELKSNI